MVQVSAHFPPNFVSGGTLVPQRLARGLASRGHEVWVYAGHLDDAREPLSTWTETDEAGVEVRWVSTWPWTGWDDRRNFDNPEVAADFAQWLSQVRPDVVHLHSLQTLGGDLVRVAKESGAAVVVTMHDFWWACARQFLVDPDGQPCSPVVDCGSCPCQVTHTWATERRAWLAERIEHADVVLAPSRTAAEVLVANGADRQRVRVEENGVPVVPVVDRTAADGGLRLLYAGGEDPMKGFGVLREALGLVDASGDWTIDLFQVTTRLRDPRVRSRPAFTRDELGAVLAAHDVLVLPSVMRESHSILTREALRAGLPVICTDSLGPEEVVVDGVNGLVVPTADPVALAGAISALVDAPDTVAQMAKVAATVEVRTVAEQVASTAELYAELVEPDEAEGAGLVSRSAVERAEDGLLRSVLFVVGINGAPLRYRAHLPAEALATLGVSSQVLHYRDPRVCQAAATADAVVFYRVPATWQALDLVEAIRARRRSVPILYDVDDLVVDPGLRGSVHGLEGMPEAEVELWWHGVARYRTMLEATDGYIGSTNGLCQAIGQLTGMPTYRYVNGAGAHLGQISEQALARPREPGPLRIGYFSGTTTHDADWALVAPVVADLVRRRGDVELWLGGPVTLGPDFAGLDHAVHRLPMMDWTRLPARLRQVDVNLAPLVPDSVFNEAKSAIKWLEAALVATPTVASPTEPFREAIDDGLTGVLAGPQDWGPALERLLDDPVLRARTGARARRAALLGWAPAAQGHVYRAILRDALERRITQPVRTSSWVPVADDEPYDAAAAWVDAYPPSGSGGAAPLWRRRLGQARRVYRDQGARGVTSAVRRRLG